VILPPRAGAFVTGVAGTGVSTSLTHIHHDPASAYRPPGAAGKRFAAHADFPKFAGGNRGLFR
jgi:hypothetical protein